MTEEEGAVLRVTEMPSFSGVDCWMDLVNHVSIKDASSSSPRRRGRRGRRMRRGRHSVVAVRFILVDRVTTG